MPAGSTKTTLFKFNENDVDIESDNDDSEVEIDEENSDVEYFDTMDDENGLKSSSWKGRSMLQSSMFKSTMGYVLQMS